MGLQTLAQTEPSFQNFHIPSGLPETIQTHDLIDVMHEGKSRGELHSRHYREFFLNLAHWMRLIIYSELMFCFHG